MNTNTVLQLLKKAAIPAIVGGAAIYYAYKHIDNEIGVDLKHIQISVDDIEIQVEGKNNAEVLTAEHKGLKCLRDRGHKIYEHTSRNVVTEDILQPFSKQSVPRRHTVGHALDIEPAAGTSIDSFYKDCEECKAATEIRYRSNTDKVTDDYKVRSTTIPWSLCVHM